MIKKLVMALFLFVLVSCSSNNGSKYSVVMSNDATEKINSILNHQIMLNHNSNRAELIDYISASFLETPYVSNTLIGSSNQKEALVVNFDGVDCFTYIDYVVALSKASDVSSFFNALIDVRYKDSDVNYYHRKHFFTDWYSVSPQNAVDVTALISPNAITLKKLLNKKSDGDEFIRGLGGIPRTITYIPRNAINQDVLDNLRQGDLVGVYSPIDGLDVSHTGIVIKKDNQVLYRNASFLSENNKVVDVPFAEYMGSKPGIIVLRVKDKN